MRRYISTGPNLALVEGAGGKKVKMKTRTRPHDVIDSGGETHSRDIMQNQYLVCWTQ